MRWFLYNGGNDSADTALKVSQLAKASGYDLTCIGVPKTIDNDLAVTDTCPGFGSAPSTAVSVREAALDVAAMAGPPPAFSSTRPWAPRRLGGRAGLAGNGDDEAPHIILLPERAYDEAAFLAKVKAVVERVGYCVVVASEGIATADGRLLPTPAAARDSFGHAQLGGVAAHLAGRVKDQLGLKVHWALPTCSARPATWPAGPTGSRRRRSARLRCSWRSRARTA